ncbi:MAG: hypothetical protein ACMUIE_08120 [Thermoplasmatota archaeon]
MKLLPLMIIGMMVCTGFFILIPDETNAATNWEAKHLYYDQWLYFEIGTLDQGTKVEYGVRVTTPDESVNVAIMDSTNYAAFSSGGGESLVGWHTEFQVRTREAEVEIPYQQQWYFVVLSDSGAEIDIEYYVNVIEEEENGGICGGTMLAAMLLVFATLGIITIIKKR